MKKRIFSILLTLCMALCFMPKGVFAEGETVKNVATAQELVDALADIRNDTVRLTASITFNGNLTVERAMTLDLNGHVLRYYNPERACGDIEVTGDLTIIDSNPDTVHKFFNLYGGGLWVLDEENGDLIAKGGIISNYSLHVKDCTLTMNSGSFVGCQGSAGAVEIRSGTFTMNDGLMIGCYAAHLGAVLAFGGTFNMNGGVIKECTAASIGKDGVYLTSGAIMNANGGKVDGYVLVQEKGRIKSAAGQSGITAFRGETRVDYEATIEHGIFYGGISVSEKYGGRISGIIVTYKNGESEYAKQVLQSGAAALRPDDPTKDGYDFTGWYTDEACTQAYDFTKSVTEDITLYAGWTVSEQFKLMPGGRYYFDLSAMGVVGTPNDLLPDTTFHYVPFIYTGTVNAYVLKPASVGVVSSSEEAAKAADKDAQYGYAYPHSLFVADDLLTVDVKWTDLNSAGLIFGKICTLDGVTYTLRAPSIGSSQDFDDYKIGLPANNDWQQILDKNSDFIKMSENNSYVWGQDTYLDQDQNSFRSFRMASNQLWGAPESAKRAYRPVLEVMNAESLGADALKIVTLDLGGKKFNGEGSIYIIVKNGESFTAPAKECLTAPVGYAFGGWRDGENTYAPGVSVPQSVSVLTAVWKPIEYKVNCVGYGVFDCTYGVPFTLPDADSVTREGYTLVGWNPTEDCSGVSYAPGRSVQNLTVNAGETITLYPHWLINQYTIAFDSNGGTAVAPITQDYGTAIISPSNPTRAGYIFVGWDKEIPAIMPAENMTLTAQWQLAARLPDRELVIYYKSVGKLNTITEDPSLVEYTSSDESVVTVDKDGSYKAVGKGTAVITMHVVGTDIEEQCKITVKYTWWQMLIRIFLLGFIWY